MKKIKLRGGDEYDVHTSWRAFIKPSRNMIKRAKKAYNKRFRKASREVSLEGLE